MTDTFTKDSEIDLYKPGALPCGCDKNDNYIILTQYRGTTEDWDGFSEYYCGKCKKRFGRWSMKELRGKDLEPRSLRYGKISSSSNNDESRK